MIFGDLFVDVKKKLFIYFNWQQGVIDQASAVTIEEIKDKVTTLSKEVEQFQGEVLYKEKVLAKMRADHEIAIKGRGVIRDDITKCTQVVKAKKVRALYSPLTFLSTWISMSITRRSMCVISKCHKLITWTPLSLQVVQVKCTQHFF